MPYEILLQRPKNIFIFRNGFKNMLREVALTCRAVNLSTIACNLVVMIRHSVVTEGETTRSTRVKTHIIPRAGEPPLAGSLQKCCYRVFHRTDQGANARALPSWTCKRKYDM